MSASFYHEVILLAIAYVIPDWGGVYVCLERLHCQVARIIFGLPFGMSSDDDDLIRVFHLQYKGAEQRPPGENIVLLNYHFSILFKFK